MAKKVKTTKTKKQNDNALKLAARVAGRVQIRDIRLLECKCFHTPPTHKGKQQVEISHSVRTKVDKKSGLILVFPTFTMKAIPHERPEEEPFVGMEARFMLTYQLENMSGLTAASFKHFGMTNGIYNAWPYWREFVQNTIARMGLPNITLPVFRI